MLSGYQPTILDQTDSTNRVALDMAGEGAPDGTVVMARRQTGGRGRMGRHWISPEGNLYCSFLLRPDLPVVRWPELSFAAALAVVDLVANVLPVDCPVACKWPNDVLVKERKIAGILLETAAGRDGRPGALVMGIGVNLASHPEELADTAISVAAAGGAAILPEAALSDLAVHVEYWRRIWQREGFAPLRAAWLDRAAWRGQKIRLSLPDRALDGIFRGLDPGGALILETREGERRLHAGEIFLMNEG